MTDVTAAMALAFTPESLDEHPEVIGFLHRLGLGEIDMNTVSALGGRNPNWAGTTSTGHSVFIKELPAVVPTALQRTLAYEEVARRVPPGSPLRSPELLGADADAGLVAFHRVPGARAMNAIAVAGELEPALCVRAGAAIGALHGLDVPSGTDDSPLEMPPLAWLTALPVELLGGYSMAQLAGWRLVQNDAEVVAGLHALRAAEAAARRVPVHGDLRMDQFFLANDQLYLCDWEYFRLADPARDLGAFTGELVFQALYLALSDRRAATVAGGSDELDHTEIHRRATAGLDVAGDLVRAFWAGYREHAPADDPDLAARAFGFAGWHMYDRLITWGENHSQLNPVVKAIAGICRRFLTDSVATARLFGVALVSEELTC
ncbi:class V lanthionine synthetase subunit LxmK [Actinoplanes sp. NEAU-A12]|uniref:Class V lanthionine synthetase subunit LxmK n=1 Tax=Actinoplanes sandaracinus TaxID=3045177 RepID=A0ABT6WHH7_9ACTN|nr:class V lanthionine synthetase subunit LxmK [Actinoplanes sandaracinus]MDI6099140.1 class V lanthionine synthetase subunit LxmK [Actinoplanes sandaracinus]